MNILIDREARFSDEDKIASNSLSGENLLGDETISKFQNGNPTT